MPIEHILEPEVGWSSSNATAAREDTSDPISGIVLGVRFAQIRVEEPRRFASRTARLQHMVVAAKSVLVAYVTRQDHAQFINIESYRVPRLRSVKEHFA
jgi:hypothetical protein